MTSLLKILIASVLSVGPQLPGKPREVSIDSVLTFTRPTVSSTSVDELVRAGAACGASRVQIKPGGGAFALWKTRYPYIYNASSLVARGADSINLIDPESGRITTLRSSLALEPIGWDQSGQTFNTVIGGKFVGFFGSKSDKIGGFELPNPDLRFARFVTDRYWSIQRLADEFSNTSDKRRALFDEADRSVVFLTDDARYGFFKSHGFRQDAVNNAEHLILGPETLARLNMQLLQNDGDVTVVSMGDTGRDNLTTDDPYSNVLVNRSNGGIIGSYNPKIIYRTVDGASVPVFRANAKETIIDVDFSNEKYAILIESLDSTSRVLSGGLESLSETKICGEDHIRAFGLLPFESPYQSVAIGSIPRLDTNGERDISYVFLEGDGSEPQTATVEFHGGPLASNFSPRLNKPSSLAKYACSDVFLIDGSASAGAGMENAGALAKYGIPATISEIEAIREFLRKRGYDEIHIIGNSFGAVPAVAATEISWPELRSISLVAPALELFPASELSPTRETLLGHETVDLHAVEAFQDYVFGDKRPEINDMMSHFLEKPDPRATLYLGGQDQLAPLRSLPDDFPEAQRFIFPNATHVSIFRNRDVTASIGERICDAH